MILGSPLQILLLEDDARDAELLQELLELEELACEITRVEDKAGFLAALAQGGIDVILADYTLPSFDGLSALKLAMAVCPNVPFIFVSGTLGEEVAIEALKIGATDYILKTRMSRLVPSVQRALREATERSERKRAEEALQESEAYLAEAQRLSRTGSFGWNASSGELYWSDETFRIFEFDRAIRPSVELVIDRTHPEDRSYVLETIGNAAAKRVDFDYEHRLQMPNGSVKFIRVVGHLPSSDDPANLIFVGAITDVTERKFADEALRESEQRFRTMADTLPEGIWIGTIEPRKVLYVSPSFERIWGLPLEELYRNPHLWEEAIYPEDRERVRCRFTQWISGAGERYYDVEYRILRPDGATRWVHDRGVLSLDKHGRPARINGISADITDRKRAEADLQNALLEIKKLKDQLYEENVALREEIDKTSMFEEIVGESGALQAVLARVSKVAPMDSTVLITGETGTGKELIARAIHKRSKRAAHAFISVNCAAVPPSLITSELFGHEKGAFTGAVQRRLGRFELAEGGTLFLDEVGELLPETQIALLRVLQEREFERVGGSKPIRADVRLIAATNRDLQAAIDAGTFRSDLYYRLNVFPIEMPPLRQRSEDIPVLVEYFIDRFARKSGKEIRGINRATLERLQSYDWPGNVRELQNVIERSIIVCETENFTVDESWLSRSTQQAEQTNRPLLRMPASQEKQTIEAALAEAQGRISGPTGAAAKLGIPPSTLDSKIRALRINKHRFKTT
ncbi:MAG TPA: sigma 54-interacting transcriptional regulator [Bryobacteraceae bacterium]|nr:sigma 54-interacting transcriptional regulator [Bryobacteraceae bacterium]